MTLEKVVILMIVIVLIIWEKQKNDRKQDKF